MALLLKIFFACAPFLSQGENYFHEFRIVINKSSRTVMADRRGESAVRKREIFSDPKWLKRIQLLGYLWQWHCKATKYGVKPSCQISTKMKNQCGQDTVILLYNCIIVAFSGWKTLWHGMATLHMWESRWTSLGKRCKSRFNKRRCSTNAAWNSFLGSKWWNDGQRRCSFYLFVGYLPSVFSFLTHKTFFI